MMQVTSSHDWYQIKNDFYATGTLPNATDIDPTIFQLWQTAKDAGLSPFSQISQPWVESLNSEDNHLAETIYPILENIWELFKHQKICTFFLNSSFKIIASYQNPHETAPYSFLKTGQVMDAAHFGSVAPLSTISNKMPVIMKGHQHYLNEFSDFYCASVPVFNGQGNMLGALDITSHRQQLASNWLRHLLYQSYVIENEIIKKDMPSEHQLLYFQHSQDLLKTAYSGIIEIDQTGKIQKANQMALTLLNTSIDQLLLNPISNYFNAPSSFTKLEQQTGFIRSTDEALFYAQLYTRHAPKSVYKLQNKSAPTFKDVAGLSQILKSNIPLLITGNTGSGKAFLAQQIHQALNNNTPFIVVNCAAIPEHLFESELFGYETGTLSEVGQKNKRGLVELANQGILFLEEVADLPHHLQAKLLRVLQDHSFYRVGGRKPIKCHFKLISSTHQDLQTLVDRHQFRSDFYYQICGYQVNLPNLKDRDDKHDIFKNLLFKSGIKSWSLSVQQQFENHDWSGNIRELLQVVQLSATLAEHDYLECLYFPQASTKPNTSIEPVYTTKSLNQMTKQMIIEVLDQENGNVSKAAKRLNISRTTLYKHLK